MRNKIKHSDPLILSLIAVVLFATPITSRSELLGFGWPIGSGPPIYRDVNKMAEYYCGVMRPGDSVDRIEMYTRQEGSQESIVWCRPKLGAVYWGVSSIYSAVCTSGVAIVTDWFDPSICNSVSAGYSSPKNNGAQQCVSTGNPIHMLTGNEYQAIVDYRGAGAFPLVYKRILNSSDISLKPTQLSYNWQSNYDRKISGALVNNDSQSADYFIFYNGTYHSEGNIFLDDPVDFISVTLHREDGQKLKFRRDKENSAAPWVSDPDVKTILEQLNDTQGNFIGWKYTNERDEVETYDTQGRLTKIVKHNGLYQTLTYNQNGKLVSVIDTAGRSLAFTYEPYTYQVPLDINSPQHTGYRLVGMVDPDGGVYTYSYHTNNTLKSVTYPDEREEVYIYKSDNGTDAYLLTGLQDGNGDRYATWTYDSQGRAISSEHADGVDKTILDYTYLEDATDPRTIVTNPLGKQTTYHFTTIQGVRKVTQVEGHPTSSCEGANKDYSYDANGNVTSKTDWNGVTTTYTYDMDRNLELSRTEAFGTPQARTITTEWHPQFRLPTKITEPGKITEYSYDAKGRRLSSKVSSVQ